MKQLFFFHRGPFPVETLRGTAILLVVFYHVIGSSPRSGLEIASGPLRAFNDALNLVHMPIFAMLSGVVLAMAPLTDVSRWPGFVLKKIRRLYVPGAIAIILFMLAARIADVEHFSDGSLVRNLFYPYAHFWFLQAIFVILTVAALAHAMIGQRSAEVLGIAALFASALHLGQVTSFMSIPGVLWLTPFFCIGQIIWRMRATLIANRTTAGAVALAIVLAVIAGKVLLPSSQSHLAATENLLLSAGLCVAAILLLPEITPLAILGPPSFIIYLCPPLATSATRRLLDAAGVENLFLNITLGLLAGVILPIALFVLATRSRVLAPLLLGQRSTAPA